MKKQLIFAVGLTVLVGTLALFTIKAHSQDPNDKLMVPATFFVNINNRLDDIISKLDAQGNSSAMQQKLDQILANQEAIKAELQIIKIRASK